MHDERLKAVADQGGALVAAGHFASETISAKLAQLTEEREALGAKLDARRKQVRDRTTNVPVRAMRPTNVLTGRVGLCADRSR